MASEYFPDLSVTSGKPFASTFAWRAIIGTPGEYLFMVPGNPLK
jgi:hypothetical protein